MSNNRKKDRNRIEKTFEFIATFGRKYVVTGSCVKKAFNNLLKRETFTEEAILKAKERKTL